MPFCRFAEGAGMYDVTPIENMFLLEYLPSAPEGFLRVYLYARMLTLHPELGEDIADVARALRMDEESVYNAMTYWERRGAGLPPDRPAAHLSASERERRGGARSHGGGLLRAARLQRVASVLVRPGEPAGAEAVRHGLRLAQRLRLHPGRGAEGWWNFRPERNAPFEIAVSRARCFKQGRTRWPGGWRRARRAHTGGRGEGDPLRRVTADMGTASAVLRQLWRLRRRAVGGRDWRLAAQMAGRMGL